MLFEVSINFLQSLQANNWTGISKHAMTTSFLIHYSKSML
jgi:hypothetical protein